MTQTNVKSSALDSLIDRINHEDENECAVDHIIEDCGESTILCDSDARRQVRQYNQLLEANLRFRRDVPSRTDPRSILYGL